MRSFTTHNRRKPTSTRLTSNTTCNGCGRTTASTPTVPYGPLKDFDPILSRYYESGGQ